MRKENTLGNLERNLISSGQKIPKLSVPATPAKHSKERPPKPSRSPNANKNVTISNQQNMLVLHKYQEYQQSRNRMDARTRKSF